MNVNRHLPENRPAPPSVRQVALYRLLVWLIFTLATFLTVRATAPGAWRSAAVGAICALVYLLLARSDEREPERDALFILADVVCASLVTAMAGGLRGPYTLLFMGIAAEANAVFGLRGALLSALAPAGVGIVQVIGGRPFDGLLVYSVSLGLFAVSAIVDRMADMRVASMPTVLPPRRIEEVEQQVEELQEQNRKLRGTYQELTSTARDQKARLEELVICQQILSAAAGEGDAPAHFERIARILMESFEAGGAVLWLANARGDRMEIATVLGRVAPMVRDEAVGMDGNTLPSDIRAGCMKALTAASPAPPSRPHERPHSDHDILDPLPAEKHDVLCTLVPDVDQLIGVIGLSGARSGRFAGSDSERMSSLVPTIGLAVQNVLQRSQLQRNVREIALLYEMTNLVQTVSDVKELYAALVEMVNRVAPCENCTVFVYDPGERKLTAKATRGQVVNLIDHISFEHGTGISGWVAQRRKQLFIPDLTQEPGLLDVELIPPRVRSFISVPMVVQENVVGVLNVSDSRANAFSIEEAHVLAILAGQAALTIERAEVMRSLEEMAITDGLTRLYNHRYFQLRLDNEVKRATRYSLPLSLIMLDIDHFKDVNDRYGHASGDLVLAELAGIIRENVRETEIVARYGGEEFAVIFTQTDGVETRVAAERVRATVESHPFRTTDGAPVAVTVSIGLASYPSDAAECERLLELADQALYAAKGAGRNCVRCATRG